MWRYYHNVHFLDMIFTITITIIITITYNIERNGTNIHLAKVKDGEDEGSNFDYFFVLFFLHLFQN